MYFITDTFFIIHFLLLNIILFIFLIESNQLAFLTLCSSAVLGELLLPSLRVQNQEMRLFITVVVCA